MSDEWCVRCGAGPPRQAGAEMAEKLAIRKCFLVCCERVILIFNIWQLAIRKRRVECGAGALAVEARAAWTI